MIIVATNDFDSIFAANRIATAIGIKQKSGGGTLAGIVANRASDAELVGPVRRAHRVGVPDAASRPPGRAASSRLKAQTVFEIDPTGAIGAPWMELAQRLLDGVPLTIPTPVPERELFGMLGGDYVHDRRGRCSGGLTEAGRRCSTPDADVIERDDFCSLAPIGWLHHKMQDSFFWSWARVRAKDSYRRRWAS